MISYIYFAAQELAFFVLPCLLTCPKSSVHAKKGLKLTSKDFMDAFILQTKVFILYLLGQTTDHYFIIMK